MNEGQREAFFHSFRKYSGIRIKGEKLPAIINHNEY